MAETSPAPKINKGDAAIGGAAGAGGGTLLLTFAQNLPDDFQWKK